MGQFDIIYTGIGSAEKIPDLKVLREAESKFYDTIAAKDEQAYERRKSSEKELLELSKTDPVLLITDANRKEQAVDLEKYNSTVAKMYLERGGAENLTMADKLKIRQMRDAVEMKQNTLLADQERYLAEKDVMLKDTRGFYDPQKFAEAEKTFYATGEYPNTGLMAAPQDILLGFKNKYKDYSPTVAWRQWTDKQGNAWGSQDIQNMTPEQAKEALPEFILSNQGYIVQMLKDADKDENQEELKPFLLAYDENKNGIVDPAEKQKAVSQQLNFNNPLLQWAAEHYSKDGVTIKPGTPRKLTSEKKGNYSVPAFGANYTVKNPPIMIEDSPILQKGQTTYKSVGSYSSSGRRMNVPLTGTKVLNDNGDHFLQGETSSQPAIFMGVLERQDGSIGLHFITPSDNWEHIQEGAGANLDVPAENLPDMWAFPVEYKGKLTTIGSLIKNKKGSATTISTTTTSESKKTSSYDKYKRPVK